MIKNPDKIMKLLVVAGILFFVVLPPAGKIAAAADKEKGPAREWVDKARTANSAGKYDEAFSCADKALQIKPDYPEAYNLRGLALYYVRRLTPDPEKQRILSEKAIEDFGTAIKLKPDFTAAYKNRGNAKRDLGLYDSDIEDQNMALKLVPNDAGAYSNRGEAYYRKKMFDEAIADFSRALEIDPNKFVPYRGRGNAYFIKNEYDLAIQDYNKAILLRSGDSGIIWARGRAYFKKGEYDLAIADLSRSLEIDPAAPAVYSARADAYRAKGEYDLAISDYSRSIELYPEQKNLDAYLGRGMAYKAKGQVNEALGDLRKAAAIDLTSEGARQELAKLEGGAVEEAPANAPSTGSPQYAGPAQPSAVDVLPQPAASAPAQAVSSGPARVLAPFTGYSLANLCEESTSVTPGVPWRQETALNDGPVGAKELGQYQALLRHTMQGLRLFYGTMSQEEEKTFNAFWAPFFDHPIKAALEYFKQITPLLDELVVAMNDLDGMLSDLGVGLQEVLLVAGDPESSAGRMASVQYQAVKTQRAKVDDLVKRIEALGNPPNPLAAKCAARKRHRKAIENKEPKENLLPLLKKADRILIQIHTRDRGYSNFLEEKLVPAEEPLGGFRGWMLWYPNALGGPTLMCNNEYTVDSARCHGKESFYTDISVVPSDDGWMLKSFYGRDIGTCLSGEDINQRSNIFGVVDVPLVSLERKDKWVKIVYEIKGPSVNEHIKFLDHPSRCADEKIHIEFRIGDVPMTDKDRKNNLFSTQILSECPGSTEEGVKTDSTIKGQPENKEQPGKESVAEVEPEKDPQLIKEAIDQHAALAAQARRDAERWAADAQAEKNDDRRQELERRAAGSYANAQSEKDIAESLATGTMVHTRTEWDERQHQDLVNSVKKELTVFSIENKLMANIPNVGDMIGGLEGVQTREQMQQRIDDAIKSPDRLQKLAGIYADLQNKVINQGEQQMAAAQDKVEMWDRRLTIAENVQFAAATGIMLGSFWAPAELGSLALGYTGATGFAEDGVKGAAVAITRSVSMKADVIISAYEGAIRIDPKTKEPAGALGALEGAVWSIGTNKAFEAIGGRIQKFKAEYASASHGPAGAEFNADKALASQGEGGAGFKPVAKAKGEAGIKEYDFKTPEHRYEAELAAATTPQQTDAVNKKYAIQAERQKMSVEIEGARQKAENDIHRGGDPAKVKEDYNKALDGINEKYKDTTRNQEHFDVMEELKFNAAEPTPTEKAKGVDNRDIIPTGSAPKTAASDMDFMPKGSTPHEAYQKGKSYVEAMKKRGHSVNEYGDRWVDNTTDATIWKPGFGADNPGSSSFEAEAIFGSLPHSDKFATKGGIEWTSSPTHATGDPLGAVIANAGKAAGAGLGNSYPKDLHTVGKSAVKAVEAAGIQVDPELKAQIDALKGHKTPEQAGIYELGADQAAKDKKTQEFLGKVETLMGKAYNAAKTKSELRAKELEMNAKKAGESSDEAYNIRAKIAAYRAGDNAALTTIAQVSPGLGKVMAPTAKVSDIAPEISSGDKSSLNLGGLARALYGDREDAAKAPAPPADPKDPAFAGLSNRCKEGAKKVQEKLAAAKPGTEEAKYLAELKSTLEQGEKNPAEAVRNVRGLSGQELAVVLAQLGVPKEKKSK